MIDFFLGMITGIVGACTLSILAYLYSLGWPKKSSSPQPAGSPVVSRRPAEKRKPKIQDDHKAWVQEQKEPRERV
jgi:hypothetical protein